MLMLDDSPFLISIVNFLYGGQGHVLEYHLAVSRAAYINGWKHSAAYSLHEDITCVPQEWCRCLHSKIIEKGIYDILKNKKLFDGVINIYEYGSSVYRFIQIRHRTNSIIFMECFNSLQLLSLLCTLLVSKREGLHLWLMYRNKPQIFGKIERLTFKLCNSLFALIFKNKFKILTDSDLLEVSLTKYFNRSVTTMPIPHTPTQIHFDKPINYNEIVCWWGGSPRHCKGWDIIKRIAASDETVANKLTLVAAKGSNLQNLPGGVNLLSVNDVLDHKDYINMFVSCDICLLPYDPNVYSESTSGIFVECIVAGKIPVVSKGTWMAHELIKYQLEELITEWQDNKIVEWLLNIAQQKEIRAKLISMQNEYKNFHNEHSYSKTMKELFVSSL
jgi:hypothetical protein